MNDRRQPPNASYRGETVAIRGLDYRLHCWGSPDAEPLMLLHGWGDTGVTFRFLVESLGGEWRAIAPDWRGFGDSGWQASGYWFPDYLADLDAILAHVSPDHAVHLVGHSMGGNVAGLYAGLRPERVKSLVSIEGFGLPDARPGEAPQRYRRWLDQQQEPPGFRAYASIEDFAARLRARNPRLDHERARAVAEAWSRADGRSGRVLKADPRHRLVNPVPYRRAEAEACWREVRAPVLLVAGDASQFAGLLDKLWLDHLETGIFPDARRETVPGAGHMVHHEQPGRLAAILDKFLMTCP